METGIELIAKERQEQIEKHGFTAEHDKQYIHGELTDAAHFALTLQGWPRTWSEKHKNIIKMKPYKERCVIAAALLVAEIDRLNAIK